MRNEYALSPWTEFNRMWNMMDRYLPSRDTDFASFAFPIDMYRQDNNLVVRASVPGVKPENLNVSLEQNVLTISGETFEPSQDRGEGRVFHREHSYGKFMRSIRLPSDVDENSIDAQCEQGVLTIKLPITQPQKAQPRQIAIKQGASGPRPIEANAYADRPPNVTGNPAETSAQPTEGTRETAKR